MPDKNGLLEIGELGRLTGTTDATLRYYEKLGLVQPVARVSGRRRYDTKSAANVAMIRLCQDAGFTLGEIGQFIAHRDREGRAWTSLAESKIRELDTRIADAQRARTLLQHALGCSHPNLFECPRFQSAVAARMAPANDD
jgi:DNA-binding transcriptional MerR regulator